jgi:putative transposase
MLLPAGARASLPASSSPLDTAGSGVRGWHSRGYLPHFDSADVVQFVTFRLADSMPTGMFRSVDSTAAFLEADRLLDEGRGACWLGNAEIAGLVEQALLRFDRTRYRLLAWCIMPNHVHVLVQTLAANGLPQVMHNWKGYTASAANRILGRSGAFWQKDYFDRFMRNDDHLATTQHYIEHNPVKAGLATEPSHWRWCSQWRRA